MLAARLAERGQASVLIDHSGDFGRGVAYSTPFPGHLLNVRADRMSAVEGRPGDFVDWLKANAPDHADPDGFAPRALYGRYVQDRLATVEAAHPGLIRREVAEVAAVTEQGVRLVDGRTITGAAVVLATGNPPPRTASGNDRVLSDPWAPGALDRIGESDDIVIVGTGLTMVDVIQALDARGWTGRTAALSLKGLLPLAHGDGHDAPAALSAEAVSGPLSRRLKTARALSRRLGWRAVMEGYRPVTTALWAEATTAERARFLRHLRSWWDVHRHRIAPQMAQMLARLKDQGRLVVKAGPLDRIEAGERGVAVHWRPAAGGVAEPLNAAWAIDCTGPGHDPATHALTAPLIAAGRARLEPLGQGLDLDAEGRVRDATGRADGRLWILGPPARAAYWETIAVPDIRKRIEIMVAALI
ncbi:MAG: FAD/NAD(P)-binding protein [Brevundimonas sp.]|nr:FAD/NAD(P)-binding protein [Brevundimonas sp.]